MAQQSFEEPQASSSFFAPPPAAEPAATMAQPQPASSRPEPFAEADLANAARSSESLPASESGKPEGRRSSSSLFARVTGAARALQAATAGSAETTGRNAAPLQRPREPVLGQGQPQPVRERETTASRPPSQPRLTGVDATEKVRTAEAEEDLLDIPAFLRRQAN